MPRMGSDVVGGKSGRNHPTSRRHPIHIGRMARNAYIRVGWYKGVVQYCTTPWLVRWKSLIYYNSQLRCTRSAPDRTTSRWSPDEAPTADSGSGTHSHWLSRQHRGTIGASDRLMWSGHKKDFRPGLAKLNSSRVYSGMPGGGGGGGLLLGVILLWHTVMAIWIVLTCVSSRTMRTHNCTEREHQLKLISGGFLLVHNLWDLGFLMY